MLLIRIGLYPRVILKSCKGVVVKKFLVLLLMCFLHLNAEVGTRYLIVAPDSFVSATLPLARRKEVDTVLQLGSTEKKKRVKAGGDIAHLGGGVFFVLKGNKTLELGCYVPAAGLTRALALPGQGVWSGESTGKGGQSMPRALNPAVRERYLDGRASQHEGKIVNLWMFDITGRLVLQWQAISSFETAESPAGSLAPGVYFLGFETDAGYKGVSKVTVVR